MDKSKETRISVVREKIQQDTAGTIRDYMAAQGNLNVYRFLKTFYTLERYQNSALYHSIYNRFFIPAPIFTEKTSAYNTSNESQLVEILPLTAEEKDVVESKYKQFNKMADEQTRAALFSSLCELAVKHETAISTKLKSLTKGYADRQKNLSDEPLDMQTDGSETDSEPVYACC